MRDLGLTEAINAAGGVTELARRIGISQPSVTNWDRVPADRVVAVEQATGVARMRLRPDLYGEAAMASDVSIKPFAILNNVQRPLNEPSECRRTAQPDCGGGGN